MSTALALTASHVAPLATGSGERPIAVNDSETLPSFVYGDSTPFPHDCNYVDVVHEAVQCGVLLLRAQHALTRATARSKEIEERRCVERTALLGMAASIRRAVIGESTAGVDRITKTGARLLAMSTATVEAELAACDNDAKGELTKATAAREEAQAVAFSAMEAFARAHDVPGGEIALRLFAKDGGYDAQTILVTPFQLEAAFDVTIPVGHPWTTPRRVSDLCGTLEVRVPRDTGWFSEKVELARVKLSKLTIRRVTQSPAKFSVTLGKGPKGGPECELSFDPRSMERRARFRERREAGAEAATPFELCAEDAGHVHEFCRAIAASTRGLSSRRRAMTQAFFRGKAFAAAEPETICKALIDAVAPAAREMARRSGASGELVLRRDAGTRRRDEIYITKAELMEKIMTLPPGLRAAFDPLELSGPRSPRAPAPSLPAYEEIGEADIILG